MPFGGGEVYEATFAEQVHLAAVFQFVLVHERANFTLAAGQLFQRWDVNLDVEVAGVAHNRPALHFFEMLGANHALVAGYGDENVAFLHRFGHRHDAEAVHYGFNALHGIDFGDDDVRPQSFCTHSHAAATPAVAGDDDFEACEQDVGGANDAVNRGLAGAVTVVEEMLGHRIVYRDDRILQRAVLSHGAQADHAGGGLFGPGNHIRNEIGALGQEHGDEIRAVVHSELRLVLQSSAQVRIVGVIVLALDGKRGDVVVAIQRCGHFVLRRKWIGGAQHHIGATIA